MKIQTLLFTALLGLATSAAFGATPAPATDTNGGAPGPHGLCAKSPDQCTQLAAKFDEWCQANAQKCTNLKAHIEKRREYCEQNQQKCKAMMQRIRHHGQQGQGDQEQGGDDEG